MILLEGTCASDEEAKSQVFSNVLSRLQLLLKYVFFYSANVRCERETSDEDKEKYKVKIFPTNYLKDLLVQASMLFIKWLIRKISVLNYGDVVSSHRLYLFFSSLLLSKEYST